MKLLDDRLLRVTSQGWELVGQLCPKCGKIAYPRKQVCPRCFSAELEEYLLSRHGTLHTYTTTYAGPTTLPSPYTMGFVDLPEHIKLMGIIRVPQPAEDHLKIGMPMDMVFDVLRCGADGEEFYCYMFVPAGCAS